MANPYPPNPGMQQMQQPMQQQPMQQMPPQMQRPKPVKQGTSRAVPIVVSAGLAVGVFCGLLFGVGIPEDATASPSTGNNVKPSEPDTTPVPTPSSTASKPASTQTVTKPATPLPAAGAATGAGSATTTTATPAGAGSGSATTTAAATPAGAGSGSSTTAKPGAGSGSAAAAVAAPAVKKVKLIVEVKPDTIAATAKITVDKVEITGGSMELELPSEGKKEVKVVVKASGYKTVEQKVDVEGDVTVKVELIKRSGGGGGTNLPRPKTGGGGKKKPPGGGLIDL